MLLAIVEWIELLQNFNSFVMRSKLLDITINNLGCIGNDGLTVNLDNILCLVGDNNTGKSTVLKAYELAVGSVAYNSSTDRCNFNNEDTSIEITVHIPEGVENIAEKWKEVDGDLRRVRSKWTWDETGSKTRQTFNPETGEYAEDGNAAGLDNVFKSRLPVPFRIGALESPDSELKELLKLIVEPIAAVIKKRLEDADSEISKALEIFNVEASKPVFAEKDKIEKYGNDISKNHASIFPNLGIDLSIGLSKIEINPIEYLLKGSKLNITEFDQTVNWSQQGTGSKRALFWSLLQVRSKLQAINNLKLEQLKRSKQIEKEIKKLEKERDKAAKDSTKSDKNLLINELIEEFEELKVIDFEEVVESTDSDLQLPGYMLLIDEPEIALHPNGIRAASKYLYELAKDSSWQIMLTTHSPLFVNPFEDNTTIVRLARIEGTPSPLSYRSDSIKYSEAEIEQLSLLNSFDQNLAEMFFGQHPIIVEGDTEFAAFNKIFSLDPEKYPISNQPLIIRARGKFTILPLMKMLNHFKVDFSILHDSDYPKNKNGKKNGVWSGNEQIRDAISKYRSEGRGIIHRISISTFEIEIKGPEVDENGIVLLPSSKGKPFEFYTLIGTDKLAKEKVEILLDEISDVNSRSEPFADSTAADLDSVFLEWTEENEIEDNRYKLD